LALLVAAVLAAACTHEPPAEGWKPTGDRVPVNEEALVADALADYFKGKAIVFRAESIPVMKKKSLSFPQDLKTMTQVLPGVTQPLLDAFVAANKKGFLYKDVRGATLAPAGKLEALMRDSEDGFAAFKKAYPKATALVTASRPGVDPKRKTALVYVTATTGDLAGNGLLFLLKREDERWRLAKKAIIWSSN
jgi:hypothetical protein